MEYYLKRHDSQNILFAREIDRLKLNKLVLPEGIDKKFTINLWKNHNFESLLPYVDVYAQYGGISLKWNIGSYDDSFSFLDFKDADIEVIWMDSSRLLNHISFDEWLTWLASRLRALRVKSKGPIVLLTWIEEGEKNEQIQGLCDELAGVYFADLNALANEHNVKLLDNRFAAVMGTAVSNHAQLLISREIACKWLPALVLPPVKAIAVDLDNTLHKGVLGEDGVHGVCLTRGHLNLQKILKKYQSQGIFLALISKNEKKDVLELFDKRLDYPLRLEDFSSLQVSWEEKANALKKVSEELRVSVDSIIFVDDNPGEIINVLRNLTHVKTVFAEVDADLTARIIEYCPGLWRWKLSKDDFHRINDLRANKEREDLAQELEDPDEYLGSLKAKLSYDHNSIKDIERITALSNKTNQFNLSLRRFSQIELANKMRDENSSVVSVKLSDRFSESGIIAIIVANKKSEILEIEELCMSCRAMGRGLESYIILNAINFLIDKYKCISVQFTIEYGERNSPALEWIKEVNGSEFVPPRGKITIEKKNLSLISKEGLVEINKNWD